MANIQWLTPIRLCVISWLLRLALILYGELQDRLLNVKFTDIDYRVFSDASAHVLNGHSPYNRHTYRYTPLLAWTLVPNHVLFYSYGKLVFISLDVLSGWVMCKVLQLQGVSKRDQIIACSFWLLNPLIAVVSSRGNAESVMAFLLMVCLYALMRDKVFVSALLYGLAVHVKIYPIIYSLPLVLKLGPTPWVRNPSSRIGFTIKWKHFINYKRMVFAMTSTFTFILLTATFYGLYGWQFLYESLLYHVTRTDIRHNFSVYFYMLYLTQGMWVSPFISLLVFVPQLGLVVMTAIRYHRDLPFCFFVQTFLFVTFNKVCTSQVASVCGYKGCLLVFDFQYFLWYLTFLPLIIPGLLSKLTMKEAVIMLTVWFGAQGMWLFSAYLLEYHGLNTFLFVWLAGLVFFGVNVWIISTIMNKYNRKDTKMS